MNEINKNSMCEVFDNIYQTNAWTDPETRSGPGATLEHTKNLRDQLPILFNKFNINTILDAPCGDFNWMKEVKINSNMNYIGCDIVPDIIKNNNKLYKKSNINFEILDITKDKLPKADLLIARAVLFHFSYSHISLFFKNFIDSNIPYLLTTTHVNYNNFQNMNIQLGDFFLIDLFSSPFNLDRNVLYTIDDYVRGHEPMQMVLFSREQIVKSQSKQ